MKYTAHYDSPLGGITLASDGEALTGLWFDGQKFFADTTGAHCEDCTSLPVLAETRRWLDIYFSGRIPSFVPSLRFECTEFRRRVWEILLTIPYGRTVSYGDIARRIAKQMGLACMSAQAVGGAVGHNPISIIIPCHRVVGSDGSLTGYAGGMGRKQALLQLERGGLISCGRQGTFLQE